MAVTENDFDDGNIMIVVDYSNDDEDDYIYT